MTWKAVLGGVAIVLAVAAFLLLMAVLLMFVPVAP